MLYIIKSIETSRVYTFPSAFQRDIPGKKIIKNYQNVNMNVSTYDDVVTNRK